MNRLLRWLFILFIAWPLVWIWLGVSVSNRKKLPLSGPAIIVANHNSHLDVLTLFTLFPLKTLINVHPVAAADYFLKNRVMAWFALDIIGIIPIHRDGQSANPLAPCTEALANNKILILFPEGTRGEPGKLSEFKSGIWHLSQSQPDVPIIPVYLQGLDRALGKGQKIPIPFFIDIYIDDPLFYRADKAAFKETLLQRFLALQQQAARRT